jgi:hypothetical protein
MKKQSKHPNERENEKGKMILRQSVRRVPYYSMSVTEQEKQLARRLRSEFVEKIARRLPGHHLRGFRFDFIVNFVRGKKKQYPYFFRTDIETFYPSIAHKMLIVHTQIAYRDLLGLDYVPKSFKQKYIRDLLNWCKNLPTSTHGIPIGSPVSAIAAPVMLTPLWLELKRSFHVPFLVYMDDLLVFCHSQEQCGDIFSFLENKLPACYGLKMNISKTGSGQFSKQPVSYCGWYFSGGYSRVADQKMEGFKTDLMEVVKKSSRLDSRTFLKRINRKIDGFGNYYKHGDVCKQFVELDIFIRSIVRQYLKTQTMRKFDNKELHKLGLHSLELTYRKLNRSGGKPALKQPCPPAIFNSLSEKTGETDGLLARQTDLLEKLLAQLTQILSLQRQQIQALNVLLR